MLPVLIGMCVIVTLLAACIDGWDAAFAFFSAGLVASIVIWGFFCFFGALAASDPTSGNSNLHLGLSPVSSDGNYLANDGIGKDAKFYAYVQDSEGLQLRKYDSDQVHVIHYTGTPYMIQHCHAWTMPRWIIYPLKDNANITCDKENDEVTFYVPDDGISSSINLNLPTAGN